MDTPKAKDYALYEYYDDENGQGHSVYSTENVLDSPWCLDDANGRKIYLNDVKYGYSLEWIQPRIGEPIKIFHVDVYEHKMHVKTFKMAYNFTSVEKAKSAIVRFESQFAVDRKKKKYLTFQMRETN